MKLLFDQNISYRILKLVEQTFSDSAHTRISNLENAADIDIWNFAKQNDFTIVTFDIDFVDLALLKGFPPKIIWLKFGNASTIQIADTINKNQQNIKDFLADSELAFFELF